MPQKHDDLRDDFQRYQLHSAARHGDVEKVSNLIARKYPLNRFDDLDRTPLHYAVEAEHFEIVDLLLHAGANVNARADEAHRIGDTPLAQFIETMSFDMAQKLIAAGADPLIRGWMQRHALDRAEGRKDADGEKIRKLLLQNTKRLSSR